MVGVTTWRFGMLASGWKRRRQACTGMTYGHGQAANWTDDTLPVDGDHHYHRHVAAVNVYSAPVIVLCSACGEPRWRDGRLYSPTYNSVPYFDCTGVALMAAWRLFSQQAAQPTYPHQWHFLLV